MSALRYRKALDISAATIEQLLVGKVGLGPKSAAGKALPQLLTQIHRFSRHLSKHLDGFVITEQPPHTLVPIENTPMEDRTIVQWGKEDIEDLTLMKVNVLALGMLTAPRKSLSYRKSVGRFRPIPSIEGAVFSGSPNGAKKSAAWHGRKFR